MSSTLVMRFAFSVLVSLLLPLSAQAGTLSEMPLNMQSSVPPNVLFALSVEYPTANTAAYQDSNSYSAGVTYLGLFDSEKCYSYNSARGFFYPTELATSHTCTGKWSGNFLNWASMTGLDEFRYAMTGGDRFIDTSDETVVQRSYQSGQGGTGNFTDKTFRGSGATSYNSSLTLRIANQGRGTQMRISSGATGTIFCGNPSVVNGVFTCDLRMQTTNEAGTCTTWTGTGTSASPYRCNPFGAITGWGTPTSAVVQNTSTGSSTATDRVTCTSPTGATLGTFGCTLRDSANNSGSCTTWSGNGTVDSPFSCSTFGTFAGANFVASSADAAASYTAVQQVQQPAESVSGSCTYSSGTISCTLSGGRTFTCTKNAGSGTSSDAYRCDSPAAATTISGSTTATYVSHTNNAVPKSYKSGKKTYYFLEVSQVVYSLGTNATFYYVPGYSGSDTASFYYYSSYALTFGGYDDYYVRAKVCDSSVGLESNCQQYGSSYKPVGELQRNGENMRFGVFSYYNANDIDNAVMRSPLKYVAPRKWTSSGTTTANAAKEWDGDTGILVANPDPTVATNSYGGAVSNSGVVNYINKFGTAAQGYKTYDNVGKLYYEALKYLRGLQPTSAFYTGTGNPTTTSKNDGFPIVTTWDDPVSNWCQKNFIIAMGDTHTWCDKRLPGGTFTSTNQSGVCGADYGSLAGDSGVNVTTETNALGTLEGAVNLATSQSGLGSSQYMAGLAYWAGKTGFRTINGNPVKAKTFVIDVQENADQGVNSQYWRAAKYGVGEYDASGRPLNWSTTISGYTGAWPKNLLPAGNPTAMIAAVRSAISQIAAQVSAGSDVGVSTGDLRTGNGTNLYSASYNSVGWSGDLAAYRMGSDLQINSTPIWRASTYLNEATLNPTSGTPPWTTRRVLTYNNGLAADGTQDTSAKGRQGVDFISTNSAGDDVFSTQFSAYQQALLNADVASLTTDGLGGERVDYIRGDSSNEGASGNNWRVRQSTNNGVTSGFSLGDFIHSSPLYVRFPDFTAIQPSDYETFSVYAENVKDRTPVVYAGANDGMLHAFNASDSSDDGQTAAGATANSGRELLAYVPSAVYKKLPYLTWTGYSHKYFVDGSPVSADVQLTSSCDQSQDSNKCWRTMVTGGLGAGGQGVYALDVTDPSVFSSATAKSLVMWEFNDTDDSNLGYTFAQPVVRKMKNGRWAVIFGNGYNNTEADGRVSSTGRAYLYVVYVDGPGFDADGRGRAWVRDTHYKRFELFTTANSTTPLSPANGLSAVFPLDKDGDGTVDYLYAGDRYGNLWKVDVSNASDANWGVAFGTADAPLPLFTATDSAGTGRQQITTSPVVAWNPNGGFMVLFGTGSFVDTTDNTSPFGMNSFYGIWDKDDGSTRVTLRSSLQKQATLAATSSGTIYGVQSNCQPQYEGTAVSAGAATALCPASLQAATAGTAVSQQLGWVLDLKNDLSATGNTGERYMSASLPVVEGGTISFVTLTPSGDVCGGNSYDYSYTLDYLSGGATLKPVYYTTSGGSVTPLTVSVTVGTTAMTIAPNGRKLSSSIGQNGKSIAFQTDRGSITPSSSGAQTGCHPFVKGRICPKQKYKCNIITTTAGCENIIRAPATGQISWRQIYR